MGGRLSGGSSRKLAVLFLAVVAPPAVTLVWLGLQLLEQDRSLWAQRELERRQAAAQAVIRSLEQSLGEAARPTRSPPPAGMVRFTLSEQGVAANPADRVLWLPVTPGLEEAATRQFADAEQLEFQGGSGRALLSYQDMARAPQPAVRAGALLRLARVHRRAKRWDDALRAYRDLVDIFGVAIEGIPADLVARRAVCSVLEEAGRTQELGEETASLEDDFLAGRWMLDQPAWELTATQIEGWRGQRLPRPAEAEAFSAVAEWLWDEWQRNGSEQRPMFGRRRVQGEITLLWGSEGDVLAIAPSVVRAWTEETAEGERLSLLTDVGRLLVGAQPSSGPTVVTRAASETGLPWTLVLNPGDASALSQELVSRRRLLSAGLAAIVLLLGGGSYLLWRVIRQELAVARVQTDFVSTVSHEFRTPLASLRHVTELLQEDDELPAERRRSFYDVLGRNTERLQRQVESLLDFSRMESGQKPYDFETLDAGELAGQVVADFRKEVGPRGFTVDLEVDAPGSFALRADAAALTSALWNLLDNAVKYSAEGRTIHVSVERQRAGVAISVRDDGLGIPRQEQKEIFRRFVRGAQASRLGIKGTGLGLAMVSHIVRAHEGTIELESEEGAGSTFRLVLPAHA